MEIFLLISRNDTLKIGLLKLLLVFYELVFFLVLVANINTSKRMIFIVFIQFTIFYLIFKERSPLIYNILFINFLVPSKNNSKLLSKALEAAKKMKKSLYKDLELTKALDMSSLTTKERKLSLKITEKKI